MAFLTSSLTEGTLAPARFHFVSLFPRTFPPGYVPESHDENEAGRATHSGGNQWSSGLSGGFPRVMVDPLTLQTEAAAAG